jgi:hypothetical protein
MCSASRDTREFLSDPDVRLGGRIGGSEANGLSGAAAIDVLQRLEGGEEEGGGCGEMRDC